MKDAKTIINKRGVPMLQAICPEEQCGRKVNTFISKKLPPNGEDALPKPHAAQVAAPVVAPEDPSGGPPEKPYKRKRCAVLSKKRHRTDRKGDAREALKAPIDEAGDSQDGP